MDRIYKGIVYKVRYCADFIHGSYYDTLVIHIPHLHIEINHEKIRKENEEGYEVINGSPVVKIKEIEWDNGSDDDMAELRIIQEIVDERERLDGLEQLLLNKYKNEIKSISYMCNKCKTHVMSGVKKCYNLDCNGEIIEVP